MMNTTNVKKYLFGMIMIILFIPCIQHSLHLVGEKSLRGAVNYAPDISFDKKEWFQGKYQEEKEKYLNDGFGFRSFFVRLNNQIRYSLFNKANANGVIIGRENYLYEENYIKAYYGQDFIGKEKIEERFNQLKFIQDTLQKLNKSLLLVYASGKASFFPEYIPDNLRIERKETNYDNHIAKSLEKNLNYIDFNKYFVENRSTSKYPLYPKYGIHWSEYGMSIVADSIIKYIEQWKHINMPNLVRGNIAMGQAHGSDYDIGDGLNLMLPIGRDILAYPAVSFEPKEDKKSISVCVIADSYYWGLYNMGISQVFNNHEFWYYNKERHIANVKGNTMIENIDFAKELQKFDLFIILGTEATLKEFGWGFIESCYKYFSHDQPSATITDEAFNTKVKQLFDYILTDVKWMADIKAISLKEGLSTDSIAMKQAQYLISEEMKKNKN